MSDQNTESLRLADALTGNASGCICGAWSSNECGCSVVWPEDYIKEAAAELRRLHAENERLREFEREVVALLPGVYYMDPPDGGSVDPIEQLRRMSEDAERYRWLRGDSCPDRSVRWTQWEVRRWRAPYWTGDLRGSNLDAAIDAALEGKE